ncbi:MAG: FHA domain-containing protein [Phycisphaerales bacterium]|nr:FHA domain-containing protein [Phycisphaerales bacterium]MCI0630706.1 FHA domain-containing protein [Phycisphaerales bacterium]MCI0677330.1 FHA domain-containing protein [Phycisphaerales bacterium]
MPRLELRKIKFVSKHDVGDRPFTIGRSESSDLPLPNNHVSRKHCILESVNGSVRIRDLKSHGGTYVNGARITETVLYHGDRIAVGPFDLVFEDPVNAATMRGSAPPSLKDEPIPAAAAAPTQPHPDVAELQGQLEAERLVRFADAQRITALSAQLETANYKVTELAQAGESLRSERDSLANENSRFQAAVNQAQEQVTAARRETAAAAARIDEYLAANKSLRERLDKLEAQRTQQTELQRQELRKAQLEIERLRTHEATLQEQTEALEAARQLAAEKAEYSASALAKLRSQAQSLDLAARKVAELQERLAQIEVAWVEVNQQMEEAHETDAQALEAAALERHRYSSELDQLNQLRDHALQTLSASAQQMRELSERHPLPLSISATTVPKPPERRWWKFSR